MPRRRTSKVHSESLERRVQALNKAARADLETRVLVEEETIDWLTRMVIDRDELRPAVARHIFRKLIESGLSKHKIIEMFVVTRCTLDFIISLENMELMVMMMRLIPVFTEEDSCSLVVLALESKNLGNLSVLLHYGAGCEFRRLAFSKHMYDRINGPDAKLLRMRYLLQRMMDYGVITVYTLTFLEQTLECGSEQAVGLLLDVQVDKFVQQVLRETVLVHVFGNPALDINSLLDRRTIHVNATCGDFSALHLAVFNGISRNVRMLLNAGADPNIRDINGMTPLFAFGNNDSNYLLLQHGADVQLIAHHDYSIFDMIFEQQNMETMLAQLALLKAKGVALTQQILQKLSGKPIFYQSYEGYCRQIDFMRSLCIHDRFPCTLLRALTRDAEDIAPFLSTKPFADQLILSIRDLAISPYYISTLERNIRKAFVVNKLRLKVRLLFLREMMPAFNFTVRIVDTIISNFSFFDLLKLV